ncbi:hypothetical protein ACGH6Q_04865 [Gilliamella sp. BG2]|uniref:hypothetical protein n=1 Tax=Gilliamella sp. BG2 TaxID=3351509 RepID=UPI0039880DAC
MNNTKPNLMLCQFPSEKEYLNKLHKFIIDVPAANDKFIIELPTKSKYYSMRELMEILNISTIKEVEYLIKKLGLEQPKYRYFNSYKKWTYNSNALNILNLYLKYKVA